MTQRVLGPAGSPRRSRTLILPLVVALVVALFAVAGAQAVHDDGLFELDKNAANNISTSKIGVLQANIGATETPIVVCESAAPPAPSFTIQIEAEQMTVTARSPISGGSGGCSTKASYTVTRGSNNVVHQKADDVTLVQSVTKDGPDWDQVHQQVTIDGNDTGNDDKCIALGLLECSYVNDGEGATIFDQGGSKDHEVIANWRHKSGSVSDKSNILNAYAAKDVDPDDGHQILYFGADRLAVDGSTDAGFWFFRNEVSVNADGTFSGTHAGSLLTPGDILILTTFTQGGATNTVRVFKWVGTGGNESGSIQGPNATFGDCVPGSAGDNGCATVNDTSILVPWSHQSKGEPVGGWIPAGGLLEGGIDLTGLGLDGCFSSFLAETRSSPSVSAILEDFVIGKFEACGSSLTTTPKRADGTTNLAADSDGDNLAEISIGSGSVSVRDSALLNVTGVSSFTGNLSFRLCGPIASGACSASTGTAIGSPQAVTTNGTYQSAAASITSVGRYCWYAEFDSTTNGVPDATDATTESAGPPSSTGECFEVLPVLPTISTNATAGPVTLGNPISDSATLGGTASQPGSPIINGAAGAAAGGTITFRVYGPNDATCANAAVHTATVNVSGNGNYSSGNFTPTAAGTYRWVASYSGNTPNTLAVSGACNDANESSVVSPRQPTISTNATAGPVALGSPISDSATLGGTANRPDGTPAGGTITFRVYGPDDATCSGTPAFTSAAVPVSGNGNYSSGNFTPTAPGTYRWIASYSGDLPNTLAVSGVCNDPNEASVVISLQPSMTTAQSFVPNDSATIGVAAGGGNLAGSVRFRLFENATCTGTAVYDQTVAVAGASPQTVGTTNTTAYVVTASTTLSWLVEYTSTNPAHRNVTKACNSENTSLVISNGAASNTP